MAWFAFITEACEEAAKRHGVWPQVQKFRDEIKQLQERCLVRFQQFPPPYLVKKKFAGWEGRLIAKRYDFAESGEEHTVIVFLDFMTRGNNEYDRGNGFGHDPIQYGASHYENLTTPAELEQYVKEQLKETPIEPLPEPSPYEWGYLEAALQRTTDWGEEYIYESQEWNDSINEKIHLQEMIFSLLGNSSFQQEGPRTVSVGPGRPEQILLYSFPRLHIVFLAGLGTADELNVLRKQYDHALTNEPAVEALARCSCRAYPSLVLGADSELWRNIERRESGNMALSPEESQLLGCLESAPDKAYPLFINGRAGSGKSTILQYLFSNYLDYYLRNRHTAEGEPLPPLYLTCNDRLLSKAKKNVEAFLRCSLRDMEGPGALLQNSESVFKKAFRPFYSFLKEQLPLETQSLFSPIRHIDYAKFTQMWEERFRNEPRIHAIGPETCWHVIRTYIKGCSVDDFLDPLDYEEGLRKERSVSQGGFEQVYDQVWNAWYREMTVDRTDETKPGEYWDDQDLVRYVVRNQYCRRLYPVVFCDEAQDFTRVEQNAILALSLFSQRKIYSYQVTSLPFAFAGDPFQTLNPTGFRWEAVKNSFVEQFINSHHCSGQNISLNYQELLNNYRSDAEIVKFCNTVQKFRGSILNTDIIPQNPWRSSGLANPVFYFDVNDSGFWNWVEAHRNEIVFVVPCNQGEEQKYWEEEGLSAHMRFDDVTVMSTIAIKGLEYDSIIAYGFGESAPGGVSEYLQNGKGASREGDNTLRVEYFINKLYVAVSRAQHNLWIVDSASGNLAFWKYFKNENFLPCLSEEERRDGSIVPLQDGKATSLSPDSQDNRNSAEKLDRDGRENCNPYLMRRAAKIYMDLGLSAKAAQCTARALFYEKKYEEAAKAAEKDSDFTFKHQCWWLLGSEESLRKIWETRRKSSHFTGSPEFSFVERFADKRLETEDPEELFSEIIRLYTEQREQLFELENASAPWQLIVGTIGLAQKDRKFDEQKQQKLWELGQELRSQGLFPEEPEYFASLAFACGKYNEVKSLINDPKNELYRSADRLDQSLDRQVQSLFSSRKWREIYELFRQHPASDFSDPAQWQIAEANAICGDVDFLTQLLRNHYSSDLVKKILANRELSESVRMLIIQINVCAMIAAVDRVEIEDVLKRPHREMLRLFVSAFARCNAAEMQQQEVAFLGRIVSVIKALIAQDEKRYITDHFFEIGCALEKANNIKESREFYKSAERYLKNNPEARTRALKRQVVCLERHVKILDNPSYQKREAEKLRRQLHLENVEVGSPELPEYEYSNNPWDLLAGAQVSLPETSAAIAPSSRSSLKSSDPASPVPEGKTAGGLPEKNELPGKNSEAEKSSNGNGGGALPEVSAGTRAEGGNNPAVDISPASASSAAESFPEDGTTSNSTLTVAELLELVQADAQALTVQFTKLSLFPAPDELKEKLQDFLAHYSCLFQQTAAVRSRKPESSTCDSLTKFGELFHAYEEEERCRSIMRRYREFLQALTKEIQNLRLVEPQESFLKETLQESLDKFKREALTIVPQYSETSVPPEWNVSLEAASWLRDLLRNNKPALFIQILPHCHELFTSFRGLREDIELPQQ